MQDERLKLQKKILLISQADADRTSEEIIDWFACKNIGYDRVNGADFGDYPFSILFTKNKPVFKIYNNPNVATLLNEGHRIVAWFRRWYRSAPSMHKDNNIFLKHVPEIERKWLTKVLNIFIKNEKKVLMEWVLHYLNDRKNKRFITSIDSTMLNKLIVLQKAKEIGLNIPSSLITNSKDELTNFIKIHKKVITKPLSDSIIYISQKKKNYYMMYTAEVTAELIKQLPDQFGTSLFQPLLDKQFEIRTFYLKGFFYSMAIFSQSNYKTMIDFRNYDHNKPNRCVPFVLTKKVEKQLLKLLTYLSLETASIDMVYTKDQKFVFLEINPVGQFAFVSKHCNYYLEEKIVDFLIDEIINE